MGLLFSLHPIISTATHDDIENGHSRFFFRLGQDSDHTLFQASGMGFGLFQWRKLAMDGQRLCFDRREFR